MFRGLGASMGVAMELEKLSREVSGAFRRVIVHFQGGHKAIPAVSGLP